MSPMAVDRLHFTGDPEADRLLVSDPLALLIGFALDQQVTVQKAFSGPLELRRRLGHLDAARIAGTPVEELERLFAERPALHRFPRAMGRRVKELCAVIAERYGGVAARLWTDATDGPDLRRRLLALPSFGPMKVDGVIAILVHRLGVDLPRIDEVVPDHPTLGDVDSLEALERYQMTKRAAKAAARDAAR
jgi:uncharacterized HhH-GPD family protein